MKTFNLTFDGFADTQYGKKSVWHSKSKPEPKQKSITEGLDLSHLEVGKTYSVTMDESNYWTVVKVEEAGAGGGQRGGFSRAYDPLQFVSNVVGQALAAGVIHSPADIQAWAESAWKTVSSLGQSQAESQTETRADVHPEVTIDPVPPAPGPEGPWTCPSCGKQTIKASKYGGWFCWPPNGCKAKFGKDEPRITIQFDEGGPREAQDEETIPF